MMTVPRPPETAVGSDTSAEIDQLRSALTEANSLYYAGMPTGISDRDFDRMMKRLQALETEYPDLDRPDSPTHTVGH